MEYKVVVWCGYVIEMYVGGVGDVEGVVDLV